MSKKLLILCFIPLSVCAQTYSKKEVVPIITDSINLIFHQKGLQLESNASFFRKKEINLKYATPKLPFFCSLEEKSRNKFGLFLKLRVGNDETYLKITEAKNP